MLRDTGAARTLLVSIHDVMPETLQQTKAILDELRAYSLVSTTLLVVPGRDWDSESIAELKRLSEQGVEMAAHGWYHEARTIRGIRHRLHSLLISRDVAEHLALRRREIVSLMSHSYAWFQQNSLPAPKLYVPPAWALGDVRRSDLDKLPFRQVESLTGIYDSDRRVFERLPMVGYEADSVFRARACRFWNAINFAIAGSRRPVRVAIHPYDLDLKLQDDLRELVRRGGTAVPYDAVALASS
jgi:predicted deacetylase